MRAEPGRAGNQLKRARTTRTTTNASTTNARILRITD
jgi:hypothetical protein